jgi:hypothetical protein
MLSVALLAAELGGPVAPSDIAAAAAVGALDGYDAVLAKHFPGPAVEGQAPQAQAEGGGRQAQAHPRPPAAAAPSRAARAGIPLNYLHAYRAVCRPGEVWVDRAGRRYACWAVLAGIGLVESGHGQSRAPGVRSGVNAFGCCAGPMQFNLRDGPPSTWDTYGRGNVYDPADAIPAARRLLLANGARRDLNGAIWNYNHSWSYVATVKAHARHYQQGA